MIELGTGQLLQLTLAVDAMAMGLVAGVFSLLLERTHRSRGRAWFWGFTFLALAFAGEALTQTLPRDRMLLGYGATLLAIATAVCTVKGTFDFMRVERVPSWAIAVVAIGATAALAIAGLGKPLDTLVACECTLICATGITAAALYRWACAGGSASVQTVFAASGVLTLMMARTLASSAILGLHGAELNAMYWVIEIVGAFVLTFILAMGEIVAILDDVRGELEDANAALSGAMDDLQIAARMDPLTGLLNRYAFHTVVADLRRNRTLDGSVAVLDLNGLKRINDTYGHYAGDRALRSVATRLQEVVRSSDFVFRWGGDEFVLILFDVTPDVARDRLVHMPAPEPLLLHGNPPVELSVSWGVAPLNYDVEAALKEADEQLYHQRRLIRSAAETMRTV